MRLLLATGNPGKVAQIRETLAGIPWTIVTSELIGLGTIGVEETGASIQENARLKARGFFHAVTQAGLNDVAVLADDGGIEIDALNGEPGARARRWAGEDASDAEIIAYTLKRLEGVPKERRSARFRVSQILILPDSREEDADGITEGWIAESAQPNRTPGLPYNALLVAERYGKVLDELGSKEGTHRALALAKIRAIIMQNTANYA